MAIPVIMPRQGQSVETCIITRWLRKKGEVVKTGDILFSYETDKAAFDAEAMEDGVLLDIFYNEGDEVPVLTNVAVIGKPGEDTISFRPGSIQNIPQHENLKLVDDAKPSASLPAENPGTETTSTLSQRISPRAKCMAEKLGIDTGQITGSGPNGRVIARDVEKNLGQANNKPDAVAASIEGVQYTDNKLSHVRKIIAKAMFESISTSAQLTHHLSADARKILKLRYRVKAEREKGSKINITLNDMVCYSVIRALEKFPEINGHFLNDKIRLFRKVHLGFAVDTPRGLMVPAIANASDLSLNGLSDRLAEVAGQCRKGNINPEMLAGSASSFTVSNLGNYGVEMFTPIINLPQMAILGVNTILYRPADLGNGVFGFIPVIGLSLTYDHRAIDGGPATLFLKEIKEQIENFDALI
jgi:pyruvate dehydrogenase E2 component (dihydrolipoamide acetyltransferase)